MVGFFLGRNIKSDKTEDPYWKVFCYCYWRKMGMQSKQRRDYYMKECNISWWLVGEILPLILFGVHLELVWDMPGP